MPEIGALVCPPALAYAAVAAGVGVALLLRLAAGRHQPEALAKDTALRALLPAAALLLLPALSALPHELGGPLAWLHDLWHELEEAIHSSPAAHAALNAGNWCLLLLTAACAARTLHAAARMRAFARSLRGSSLHGPVGEYVLLPSDRPLCFTAGLGRPVIYVTTGLASRVSERDLEAMLAHEAAHARRGDGMLSAFLTLFFTLFPAPGCGVLLREWRQASERACDAEAALRIGSRRDVAAALARTAMLMAGSRTVLPAGVSFSGDADDVESRIHVLIGEPEPVRTVGRTAPARVLTAGIGALVLLVCGLSLHHLVALFVHH